MIRPIQVLLAAALGFTLLSLPLAARAADALPSLPPAADSFDSGSIHVDRYGSSGTPLIFIPGLSCGPWAWAEQIRAFSAQHVVYALTLDGFDGRAYVSYPDLVTTFKTDFWTLLNDRTIDKPVVIGHSLGGTLAIALAEDHPERLGGVVALDGLPVSPVVANDTDAQRESAAQALRSQVAAASPDQYLAFEKMYMKNVGTVNAAFVDPLATLSAKSDPKAVADWGYADLADDLRPHLAHATVRMVELMPYAEPSPYTKAQTIAFYTALLAGAPHVTVEPVVGARHFAMIDQPAAVDAAITRFLATAATP